MCGPQSSAAGMTDVATRVPRGWPRRLVVLSVVVVVVVGTWLSRGGRVGVWLVEQEGRLEAWHEDYMLLSWCVALLLYIVVTGFSIPVATLLSLALGRLLGFWPAVGVVSFGSTVGATLAMLLCRTLFRESVLKRLGPRGEKLLAGFERNGPFFLFTLRMMPQVPFVLVNLVMSVSSIRARTFFLVSQIGMLPATCLYVFTGSQLPSLQVVARGEVGEILTWPLIFGLVLLGCFPLVVRLCWPGDSANDDGTAIQ